MPSEQYTIDTVKFKMWINSDGPFRGNTSRADEPKSNNGLLVGMLEIACGDEESRHQFTLFCYGVASSKKLHARDRNRLLAWLNPAKFDPDAAVPAEYLPPRTPGAWTIRAKARETAQAVIRAARIGAGQLQLTPEAS